MYVPKNVITNNDLLKYMDTSDEWIQERTGIKQINDKQNQRNKYPPFLFSHTVIWYEINSFYQPVQ